MFVNHAEIEKRTNTALAAIRKAFRSAEDEYGVTLFVSHHLDELEGAYWEQHLQSASPEPYRVLDLLVRSPYWEPDEDGIGSIDFTLPRGVTNYVICVNFGDKGEVEEITMES